MRFWTIIWDSKLAMAIVIAALVSIALVACMFAGKFAAKAKKAALSERVIRFSIFWLGFLMRSLISFAIAVLSLELARKIFVWLLDGRAQGLVRSMDSLDEIFRTPGGLAVTWFIILVITGLTSWYYRDKYLGKK